MLRHRPWLWALSSSVVILVSAAVAASYPADRRRADEYRSAAVTEVRGVVEDTNTAHRRRRPPDRFVDFRLLEPSTARAKGVVEVEGTSAVWDALRPGMEVRFGVYGRLVTRIVVDGVGSVETVESPAKAPVRDLAVGLVGVPSGLAGLWAAFVWRRKSGSWWRVATQESAKRTSPVAAVFLAWFGAVVGLLGPAGNVGDLLTRGFVGAAAGGLAGTALYFVLRRRSGRADDSR